MNRLLFSVVLIFIFAGCMMEPYKQAFDEDSGPYPEEYLQIINEFLDHYLVNPESIKNLTVIKPPEKIILQEMQESISLAKGNEVWESFIAFDAKNRNGEIVRDFHVVWIRNNRIVAFDYTKPDLVYRFEHRFDPEPAAEQTPNAETDAESEPEK